MVEFLQSITNDYYLKLDPRTKIFALVIINLLAFSSVPLYITVFLVLIPFFCLLLSNKEKIAFIYILLFSIAKLTEIYLIPITHGLTNGLIIMFSSIIVRMGPGIIMGYYVLTTTKVSEFMASMDRIKIPESISIPISVLFRYFPTLLEEIRAIKDAMKMRRIGTDIKSLLDPLKLLEYVFVPVLINAVKTGEELSAASLTRGLSNPVSRTNICQIGFGFSDALIWLVSIIGLIAFILYLIGGISIA
ncbi:MAG: energy-coupling factor transporter transmembrane protein EcfT [Methanobrevibacter arboriphilus]|uniref:Energy-coupling factor transporter transmembrane protein EcfT n=1 Tax=Methanobrevibacter arboriphilus TaxID=39441 RepID=A0A843APQ8_METAZ|nr:energy-coupling factor transporter transmembrane component T [Methanobrevibacter arboriphilus]MBF4468770.1 energy-coupling factor transporter transmembrane protein EcfT [Methanobrevibacter arboriphilus]